MKAVQSRTPGVTVLAAQLPSATCPQGAWAPAHHRLPLRANLGPWASTQHRLPLLALACLGGLHPLHLHRTHMHPRSRGPPPPLPPRRPSARALGAGNHAQGVALSAAKLGCDAVICMPITTPSIKVEAVKDLGATVQLVGESYNETQTAAQVGGGGAGPCWWRLCVWGGGVEEWGVPAGGYAAPVAVVRLEGGSGGCGGLGAPP